MITLTKDLEIGVAKIDEQHRELINRINAVSSMGYQSATKEETEKTLNFLGEYIIKHFSDEEIIQKQCNYPKYDWHKAQHQIFIDNFKNLKQEFIVNGASANFTLSLNKSIIEWIVRHIKSADVEIGKTGKH